MDKDKKPGAVTAIESKQGQPTINVGAIFWGLLFLAVGTLFLLQSLNIVELHFSSIWKLWPLVIIATGVSIIPLRGLVAVLSMSMLLVLTIGLIVASLLGYIATADNHTSLQQVQITKADQAIKELTVSVQSGAGTISLNSDSNTKAVTSRLVSSFAQLEKSSTQSGSTQLIELSTKGGDNWWRGDYKNDLSIDFTQTLPINLKLDTGAVRIRGDLSEVQLRELRINTGASDIELRLGNKSDKTDVRFDIGISSVTFFLPKTSGLSVSLDEGLSSKNIPGLQEKTDNYYESSNYSTADHTIRIIGKMGMSNLRIEYY